MFYPVDVQGLVTRHLIGAHHDDPTIPHMPSRRRRLLLTLQAHASRLIALTS